ncbi:MAG: DNA mismatch repair endonuclease MutL [Lachnospiraceae bacterium]|nr:DNA mismatch repair endonuclease MutL [Lachnospiraceae bacterium]
MGKIQVLDKRTIDKIAAGEVVERPASVVKELMENSMDAGAGSITVEIKEGGISYIRITDDGCGIGEEDLKVAFLRHATSKIRSEKDLAAISSLGFRGEALSSISAVSQMEVITKTGNEMMGNRVVLEGGDVVKEEKAGAPDGTTMIVKNLFYNTPARRKFLKTPQTEASYIASLMERMSLSHPEVAFRFIVNGQTRLQTAGNGNLKDVLYRVFGREVLADCMEFSANEGSLHITGYIAKPALSRGNRSFEHFYVNGRYIKSKLLSNAVEEAYKTFIMQHKFPFVVLYLDIDPAQVDVNVHPTKMEVRFENEAGIYDLLLREIRNTLSNRDLIAHAPMTDTKEEERQHREQVKESIKPEPFERNKLEELRRYVRQTSPYEAKYKRPVQPTLERREEKNIYQPEKEETITDVKQQEMFTEEEYHFLKPESVKEHRILGQVFDTYWLVEFKDSLYIIDQHAAHERILFERTMKSIEEKEASSQQLQPPMLLSLSQRERQLLTEYRESFEKIGFVFEEFGGEDLIITAVPYNMFGIEDKELFLGMLDELSEFTGKQTPQVVLSKVAMMSCKAAVKGNQKLSEKEATAIIDELLTLDNPYHCPHGRPTIIEMKKTEMERRFHR